MESDFVAKVQASFGPNLTPIQRKHMRFALSNRVRGAKVLDEVVAHTGLDLRGKRVLDVGSAYGGFVIQAAQRGAEAWGVEIGKHLHELGKLNAQGELGAIHQVHSDFLSPAVLDVLPRDFNLRWSTTCSNMFTTPRRCSSRCTR